MPVRFPEHRAPLEDSQWPRAPRTSAASSESRASRPRLMNVVAPESAPEGFSLFFFDDFNGIFAEFHTPFAFLTRKKKKWWHQVRVLKAMGGGFFFIFKLLKISSDPLRGRFLLLPRRRPLPRAGVSSTAAARKWLPFLRHGLAVGIPFERPPLPFFSVVSLRFSLFPTSFLPFFLSLSVFALPLHAFPPFLGGSSKFLQVPSKP